MSLQKRSSRDCPVPLAELLNPLMSFIVFPFLGGGAARIELAHPRGLCSGRPERHTRATAGA